MTEVIIYHNPRCSKSRQTLALLETRGIHPTVIEYLKTPPDATELTRILELLGKTPWEILRKAEAKAAGIDAEALEASALIRAMVAHPEIIERPIVVAGTKAALGRPPEAALAVL